MFYMSFKKRLSLLLVATSFMLPTLVHASEAGEESAEKASTVYSKYPPQLAAAVSEVAIANTYIGGKLNPASKKALDSIQSYSKNYSRWQSMCGKAQASASFVCVEKTAPNLQEVLNVLNTATSTVNMSGILDNCSALGKTASLVNMGLTAYTATCSAARGSCTATCGSVKKSLTALVAVPRLECVPDGTDPNGCAKINTAIDKLEEIKAEIKEKELGRETDEVSIAGKSKACNYDYGNMISSATMGMIQMVNSMKQAQQCKDQADGSAADKCLDPEVAKTDLECICRFHPRTAGCASAATSSSAGMEGGQLASSTIDKKKSNGLGPSAGIDDSQSATPGVDGGGSGLPGAPTGGGGSGISSSGGGGSGGDGTGGPTGTPLNAKVVNGFSGGGGSGFGGGRSSASYDGYRAYLPGGKKDPATAVGGQELWKKEVTGQAGKSNWDKVRDRYRDNRSTLIDK